jgi:Bacterial regulatory protein, arsR family
MRGGRATDPPTGSSPSDRPPQPARALPCRRPFPCPPSQRWDRGPALSSAPRSEHPPVTRQDSIARAGRSASPSRHRPAWTRRDSGSVICVAAHTRNSTPGPEDVEFEVAAGVLKLLADPTRLKIVWALLHGEHSVNELADHVGARPPAVSQHLAKLRAADLVRSRRDGNRIIYAARNEPPGPGSSGPTRSSACSSRSPSSPCYGARLARSITG